MTTPVSLPPEAWRFGPDWPGQRCGAKTRRGTPCQKPALIGNARCQIHGGRGGAPTGAANGNYRSGLFTKEFKAATRRDRLQLRKLLILGRLVGAFK